MFSLLHFLASNPRNADMLKRALRGDTDARRLFSFLGVTPTHLADIDEGAIARRSAALGVPRTVEGTAPNPEQTPPEEVIVLGPWQAFPRREIRFIENGPHKDHSGVCFDPKAQQMAIPNTDGSMRKAPAESRDAADEEARKTYALIDAEPGSLEGSLPRFRRWWTGICAYWQTDSTPSDVQVTVLEKSRQDAPGWEIVRWLDVGETITLAHGPQTGEEGKRYALAAAHALGLTGGGE